MWSVWKSAMPLGAMRVRRVCLRASRRGGGAVTGGRETVKGATTSLGIGTGAAHGSDTDEAVERLGGPIL